MKLNFEENVRVWARFTVIGLVPAEIVGSIVGPDDGSVVPVKLPPVQTGLDSWKQP
jgi:hypothetical protein